MKESKIQLTPRIKKKLLEESRVCVCVCVCACVCVCVCVCVWRGGVGELWLDKSAIFPCLFFSGKQLKLSQEHINKLPPPPREGDYSLGGGGGGVGGWKTVLAHLMVQVSLLFKSPSLLWEFLTNTCIKGKGRQRNGITICLRVAKSTRLQTSP